MDGVCVLRIQCNGSNIVTVLPRSCTAKHKPMDDEELLFKQVKLTTAATPGTTVWIYRNTVYAYPWYTSVRKTLEDPVYAPWFVYVCACGPHLCCKKCRRSHRYMKFAGKGPWYSKKCDSAQPTICSDLYHSQEQSPVCKHVVAKKFLCCQC